MQGNDRKAASGFIHGFRYNVQTLINVLSHLHFQSPLPSLPPLSPLSPLSIEGISTRICDRLTVVSALFQMFGKLCDVLHVGPLEKEKEKEIKEKEEIKEEEEDPLFSHTLYTQLPREWVLSGKEKASLSLLQGAQHVFLISLQFGFSRYPSSLSSNDFLQDSGTLLSKCGAFLHPVIEHCVNGVIVETYHLFETLDIRFNLEYKKGESGSTLNSRLLVDILKECLLSSSSSSSSSPSLARLTAASTPIEEKRELFKKLIPVDHVWTEEELKVWRNFLEIKREEEKRDTECVFRPVPVSQSDIEIAREKTKGM